MGDFEPKYEMGRLWGKNRDGMPSFSGLRAELEQEAEKGVEKKIRNSRRSGICDKLEDRLGFYIYEFVDKTGEYENEVSRLKLLKLLYKFEKSGPYKKDVNEWDEERYKERKIRIIDILAHPALSNINSEYSGHSEYGEVLNLFMQELEKEVKDAPERKSRIEDLDFWWECVCEEFARFLCSDYALCHKEGCAEKVDEILRDLDRVLSALPDNKDISNIQHKESPIESFYNLTICHISSCFVVDRLRLEEHESETVDRTYAEFSREHEYYDLPYEELTELLIDYFKNSKRKLELQIAEASLLYLLKSGWREKTDISDEDRKDYLYALKYVNTLMEWVRKEKKRDTNNILIYIAALQEIIRVKRGDYKISENHFGNSDKPYAALTPLRHKEEASAYAKQWWIRRVEIRCMVNFGDCEGLEQHFKIQKKIYQIKEKSYRYQNFDDILCASKFLMRMVYGILQKYIGGCDIHSKLDADFDKIVKKRLKWPVTIEWERGCEKILYGMWKNEALKKKLADDIVALLKGVNSDGGTIFIPASKETPWLTSVGLDLLIKYRDGVMVKAYNYFLLEDEELEKRVDELMLNHIEV